MRRCYHFVLLLLLIAGTTRAGLGQPTDSTRHRVGLHRLVPHHTKLQFAGSIGWVSASAGYGIWKRKVEADISAGYIPRWHNGNTRGLFTAAVKLTVWPWRLPLTARTTVYPISVGMWGSLTPGDNLELFWPDYYPSRYYWSPTGVRTGGFLGGRLERALGPTAKARSVAAYYEAGTNDQLATIWYFNRRTVSVGSILHLALGIQLRFR